MECSELITIVKVNNKRDAPKKRKNIVKLRVKYEKERNSEKSGNHKLEEAKYEIK